MGRKVIIIALIVAILAILVIGACGCDNIKEPIEVSDRFIVIKKYSSGDITYLEMYDKNTQVMYAYYRQGYKAGLTVLLNADGTPMLYEEDKQ